MTVAVNMAAKAVAASAEIYAKKGYFLAVFVLVFGLSVLTLAMTDLLPESPKVTVAEPAQIYSEASSPVITEVVEMPIKISISSINLSATVVNPDTTDIKTLDSLLLKGVVRYPTSAMLGEDGNVVIFGHSSYLPVVGNQSYKSFNGIQNLQVGDTITVTADERVYTYAVADVSKKSANEDGIPLFVAGRQLTLATCDSFGKKSDRFVVVANFVDSHPVGS